MNRLVTDPAPPLFPVSPLPRWEARPLEWDTRFFGATMGTLVALDPEPNRGEDASTTPGGLAAVLQRSRAEGYAHLIYRVSGADLPAAWEAEQAGMRLVDIGVDSTLDLRRAPLPSSPDATVRDATEADLPALRDLAAESFVYSRFAIDPFFSPEQTRAFHREWITNLCHGLARAVLVCHEDGQVAGFVSCAVSGREGRIPLIATHAGYRRLGLGRALVTAAHRWFALEGLDAAHVKTQAHNYPALALYHRLGFTVSRTELTFSISWAG